MNEDLNNGFRLKDWEIWPLRNLLIGPDGERRIEPKAMHVLAVLASQPGDVVTRESLLDEVWPETYSGEVSLNRCIHQLRSAFSDERADSQFIETIPKVGYRLVAPVEPVAGVGRYGASNRITWAAAAIAVLVLGLGYMTHDKLILDPSRHTVTVNAVIPSDYSIAVLPFVNLSDDPANDYFSDGMTEDILNLLAKVPDLQVTSRTSAFSFKGENLDVPTIAGKLNVAHILEGSVRQAGNELRITAQLIDARSDSHLWSESYDRELQDIFAIQEEIAAAVVSALRVTLLGEAPISTQTNPDAYTLYLQARSIMRLRTENSLRDAERLIDEALLIDPDFAAAWTELAGIYWRKAEYGYYASAEGASRAHHAIENALAIDSRHARAYQLLARIEMRYDFEFDAASQNLRRAQELSPGDATIVADVAVLTEILGNLDGAIELAQQSVALDPVSPAAHAGLGRLLYRANHLEEATASFQTALSLNPEFPGAWANIARIRLAEGDAPAALEALQRERSEGLRIYLSAIVQHALGDTDASEQALQWVIEQVGDLASVQIAGIHAYRGEADQAFEWLHKAYDIRDAGLANILLHPNFANLHDDPRWETFLDQMGLPHKLK
jgi:TolB-like protein/DNA-binding winged helix-turn-helix (wHTH) protein